MSHVLKKVAARFDPNNRWVSHLIDAHGSFSNFTKFDNFRRGGDGEVGPPGFCQMIMVVQNVENNNVDAEKLCLMIFVGLIFHI